MVTEQFLGRTSYVGIGVDRIEDVEVVELIGEFPHGAEHLAQRPSERLPAVGGKEHEAGCFVGDDVAQDDVLSRLTGS
jgi:hypothetical protein